MNSLNRRDFLNFAATGIATLNIAVMRSAYGAQHSTIKAIVFDAFPIFDPRPLAVLAEKLFPEKGTQLIEAWRIRQFEYQWLRALSEQYADFWQTTQDGLIYAAELLKLDLTADKRDQLMATYLELKAWPDAPLVLEALKNAGIRLGFLSNATPAILDASIQHSGLQGMFEHVLSTDVIKTYKPARRAYQMAIDAFGLKKEEILFVAFAGWDAAGAKSFGYTTFWANRLSLPVEQLGVRPDASGKNLNDLMSFVTTGKVS